MASIERRTSFYNDHMSGEGQTSHIVIIIRLMYTLIFAYSALTSIWTGAAWWAQVMFYFTFLLCFYAWHWLAHQKWSGPMHRIHCIHHWQLFPPSRFYGTEGIISQTYGCERPSFWKLLDLRTSTNFRFAHEGPLYIMLAVVLAVSRVVLGCSWATLGCALLLGGVMGLVGSALHASFHIRGFALEKYTWYKELRALHYIHHLGNTKHNYGVLNIGFIDGVFQSVRLYDPRRKAVATAELPSNITPSQIDLVNQTAGSLGRYLLFSEPSVHVEPSEAFAQQQAAEQQQQQAAEQQQKQAVKEAQYAPTSLDEIEEPLLPREPEPQPAPPPQPPTSYPTVLLRFVVISFAIWFWQTGGVYLLNLAGTVKEFEAIDIDDWGFKLTAPLHDRIASLDSGSKVFLVMQDAQIVISNVVAFALMALAIFGRTTRPVLTVAIALISRTLMQVVTPFVAKSSQVFLADHVVWSAFSTTATSVCFLCPHVILALALLLDCARVNLRLGIPAGMALGCQVFLSLTLRTNWSLDLLMVALLTYTSSRLADIIAPVLDVIKSL